MGWREDDEVALGCFEFVVSLGHLGREVHSIRSLGWRYVFGSGHDCRVPEALGIDEVTRNHNKLGLPVARRLRELMESWVSGRDK